MKKVLLLGHPLGHSASKVFQDAGFKALGVDVTYELCEIPPEELESKIKEIRESDEYLGCNVTIPYKVNVIKYLDQLSGDYAEIIGAVNTVIKKKNGELWGYNTDVLGFFAGIEKKLNLDISDKVIFIAGAGGAGRAIEMGSLFKGARKIVIAEP
ncbi:MAG: shikimate dehydrogenase, partial [Candidatus Auribacterota bacterium]|nr:shikimate dehydrogenase [Candidatus Auribacterota bacterium]